MNELEKALQAALIGEGKQQLSNKAYLEFIKANFIIPIEKNSSEDAPEVLYLENNQDVFLPVFSHMDYFNPWVAEISGEVKLLKLSGVNLLKGIGDNVLISLNIGSPFYKEFNVAEIARMRSMILKFF